MVVGGRAFVRSVEPDKCEPGVVPLLGPAAEVGEPASGYVTGAWQRAGRRALP